MEEVYIFTPLTSQAMDMWIVMVEWGLMVVAEVVVVEWLYILTLVTGNILINDHLVNILIFFVTY